MSENKQGKLYIVATPIGNLGDISARALQILQNTSLIACEDKRKTAYLCKYYNIKTALFSYHDHNESEVLPKLLHKLQSGADVALVSDAGTPLISDPGYHLVETAIKNNIEVLPIAGACSIIAALSASGLPTDRFYFAGFLPNKKQMRLNKWQELSDIDATIIMFESVHRLKDSLQDAMSIIPHRKAVVARELSKLYEEFKRGTITELNDYYNNQNQVKGEIVLMLAPPDAKPLPNDKHVNQLISALLPTQSTKQIANLLAELLPYSKSTIYEMALKLKS